VTERRWSFESPLRSFGQYLPWAADLPLVTLGEGWTPLIQSSWIGPRVGIPNLWFKLEQINPTGSYKERFAAAQVSLLGARGDAVCLATSSGNTGSALAAYCARANLRCVVFLTEEAPRGKLQQMLAHGAALFRVRGFGVSAERSAAALASLRQVSESQRIPLIVSAYAYCPAGMEGVKTIAYEIAAQLASPPGDVFVPVGGGGLCTAIARGFADLARADDRAPVPRLHAVQPTANDTIVTPWREGRAQARPVETQTRISGLAVPNDIDATRALVAVHASRGSGVLVDDELVWEVQRDLARHEGLYVEPAGAVSVAGLWRAVQDGSFPRDRTDNPVVCILTGHGFKDPAAVERLTEDAPVPLIAPDEIGSVIATAAERHAPDRT
jgi:threonine synthase